MNCVLAGCLDDTARLLARDSGELLGTYVTTWARSVGWFTLANDGVDASATSVRGERTHAPTHSQVPRPHQRPIQARVLPV